MKFSKLPKVLFSVVAGLTLVACGNNAGESSTSSTATTPTSLTGDIGVVSREDGSGTRGAFVEITGVLTKEGDKETDKTTKTAVIQNGTEGVLSTVAGDKFAIGYISLGSLNDTVRAVPIEGVEPTSATVLDKTYKLQRPFNIAWKGELKEVAKDFVDFIHSKQGQEIAVANKYVEAKVDGAEYTASSKSGKISVVGSTSVSPLMEKFAEAYRKLNPDVTIDITSNGSSAGMTAAMEGTADIGMASRELKDSEKAALNSDAIALDGIALVVNKANGIESLTLEQVKEIYTGEITSWEEIK